MQRDPAIDLLRGVLLLLMTMTHLPTVWSSSLGQPLGFISAAEGFVLLSAFLAGRIFLARSERLGPVLARRWIMGRALQLYLFHLALLLLAFTVVAWIASTYERPAARNLLGFYFEAPHKAVLTSAMLAYQPPLLDILPMYVLFFVATPWVMDSGQRWGWKWVLAISMLVWVAAQFGLRRQVHTLLVSSLGWSLPLHATGAFDLYAWQLLWVLGLWFGAVGLARTHEALSSGGTVLTAALAVSCALLFWRHVSGPTGGFTDAARHFFWIDKWTLSPIRLVNLAALTCVLIAVGRRLARSLRIPLVEMLGRASQWAFVVHIACALLLLCLVGQDDRPLAGAGGLVALLAGYLSLFVTAFLVDRQRRPAPAGEAGATQVRAMPST